MIPGYSLAYQPIVDVRRRVIDSFEALIRGSNNEGAQWVLAQLTPIGTA